MNLKLLFFSMCFLLLVGCSSFPSKQEPTTRFVQDSSFIDPSLLVRCPDLPEFNGVSKMTMGDLYQEYSQLQDQYIDCALHNDCLIKSIKTYQTQVCDKPKPMPQK